MARTTNRPPRLPNGARVHVRSPHFAGECDGRITKGEWDEGWLYRVEVAGGDRLDEVRNQEGELWVWDFEVTPIA